VSGLEQLQYLSWLLYLVIFVAVVIRTVQRPTPAHVDMTLFFGAAAMVIVLSGVPSKLQLPPPLWLTAVVSAALMSLGYLLLRLVRDFSHVPALLLRSVEVGLVASVAAVVLLPPPLPPTTLLLLVAYLVLVIVYDAWAFARQGRRARGVTRRRMQAAAAGSLCLALALIVAGLGVGLPDWAAMWAEASALLGLASGVFYFVAFAPPTWLRRAWQEPEVRAFLARAASLPRLPDTLAIVRELERGAADALGAPAASIALWDRDSRRLHVHYQRPLEYPQQHETLPIDVPALAGTDGVLEFDPASRPSLGRAFLEQRVSFIADAARADPDNAALLELYGARTMLSAPITAGDKRLGVLVVYAPRAPVFANSDLELVHLLADQAAVILESRALLDEAARVRAREEAARLKEDFLSSAAHDLKTPLTGIVAQAQVLQRRSERDPSAPVDRAGLNRLLEQSLRLKNLVLRLLDVSRLEQVGLLGERHDVDLRHLVQSVIRREAAAWDRVELQANQPVVATVDELRFEQVLTNLVENALKYSPYTRRVTVRVWRNNGEARLDVQDRGIGIPYDDQPLIFERFHRARNVDDRRFAGMGLGLYIARCIVEQHDGRIWFHSTPGVGSTFSVALPSMTAEASIDELLPDSRQASG
jgi:signal transduction histidine kinase